jgi:hypothetical protein
MLEQAEKALTRVNALGFTFMEENASMAFDSNPHLERPEISEVHEITSFDFERSARFWFNNWGLGLWFLNN